MAKSDLQNPAFTDEDKARKALEAIRWPDGPYCPHCGNADQEKLAKGQGRATRTGLYYCAGCNGQFTVTIGTVMEDTRIPLSKWLFAMHLLGSSKKGMSALQLSRMLGVSYKSAWFLCHRIREAMTPATRGPIGGQNRLIEADETLIGGKKKNRAFAKKEPKKHTVLTLVDRDGDSHSFHIANVKPRPFVKLSSRPQAASHISQPTNWRVTRRLARNSRAMALSIIRLMNFRASAVLFMSTLPSAVSAS